MSRGFTLIEVLVSLSILFIIITTTFVGFKSFNQNQKLNSSVDNLKNILNEAKSSSLSQAIRTTSAQCATSTKTLYGNKIVFTSSTYEIQEVCKDSAGTLFHYSITGKLTTLPSGITLSPVPSSFIFKVQAEGGGIDQAGIQTITLVSGSTNRQVMVTSGGIIK